MRNTNSRAHVIVVTIFLTLLLTLVFTIVAPPAHGAMVSVHTSRQLHRLAHAIRTKKSMTPAVETLPSVSLRVGGATRSMTDLRGGAMICELSSFFSIQPEDQVLRRATLEGKGLLSCHNDEGFTAEFPIETDLSVEWPKGYDSRTEFTVSANSSPFVIGREVSDTEDSYEVRDLNVAPSSPRSGSNGIKMVELNESRTVQPQHSLVFRGQRNDVVIQLDLNSHSQSIDELKVTSLNVHFDDSAPDLL